MAIIFAPLLDDRSRPRWGKGRERTRIKEDTEETERQHKVRWKKGSWE